MTRGTNTATPARKARHMPLPAPAGGALSAAPGLSRAGTSSAAPQKQSKRQAAAFGFLSHNHKSGRPAPHSGRSRGAAGSQQEPKGQPGAQTPHTAQHAQPTLQRPQIAPLQQGLVIGSSRVPNLVGATGSRMKSVGPITVEVAPGQPQRGDQPAVSATYRNVAAAEALPATFDGAATLYELFRKSVELYGDNKCVQGTLPAFPCESAPNFAAAKACRRWSCPPPRQHRFPPPPPLLPLLLPAGAWAGGRWQRTALPAPTSS
jgi:hypothetical protein